MNKLLKVIIMLIRLPGHALVYVSDKLEAYREKKYGK